jgi:hypothetical protein
MEKWTTLANQMVTMHQMVAALLTVAAFLMVAL